MRKLATIRSRPVPDWQRDRLRRWLNEWRIEQALRPEGGDRSSRRDLAIGGLPDCARGDVRGRATVRAGQIRLVSPRVGDASSRPVFVAVIERDRKLGWLVAPYGRFAEPALPGELLTGRSVPCLRVLCLWNARRLRQAELPPSWDVDRLSEHERQSALAVWHFVHGGTALSPELETEIGPPVVHPLDPRLEYEREETVLMDGICAVAATEAAGPAASAWICRDGAGDELALAAERRAKYGEASARFLVRGKAVLLSVDRLRGGRRCAVRITDAEGKGSAVLDGAVVQNKTGLRSSPVRNGTVELDAALVEGEWDLLDPGGRHLPLLPTDE